MCRLCSRSPSKGSVFLCSTQHITELKKALGLLNSLTVSYQIVCFSARKDMYRFINTAFQSERNKELATSQSALIHSIFSYCLFKYSRKHVYQLKVCHKHQLFIEYLRFSKPISLQEFWFQTGNISDILEYFQHQRRGKKKRLKCHPSLHNVVIFILCAGFTQSFSSTLQK